MDSYHSNMMSWCFQCFPIHDPYKLPATLFFKMVITMDNIWDKISERVVKDKLTTKEKFSKMSKEKKVEIVVKSIKDHTKNMRLSPLYTHHMNWITSFAIFFFETQLFDVYVGAGCFISVWVFYIIIDILMNIKFRKDIDKITSDIEMDLLMDRPLDAPTRMNICPDEYDNVEQ